MSFLDRVRSQRKGSTPLRHPTQQGFTRADWDAAYMASAAATAPSIADVRLHRAGQWFDAKLGAARQGFKGTGAGEAPPADFTRVLVGYLNATTAAVLGVGPLVATAEVPTASGGTAPETFAPPRVDAEGLMSRLHDIVRFPLRHAVARLAKPMPSTRGAARKDLLAVFRAVLPVATAYDSLEELWSECVWNGWYVDETGPVDLVAPADPEREVQRAVSNYREATIRFEVADRSKSNWARVSPDMREISRREPHVRHIERVARRRRLVVGPSLTPLDVPPPTMLLELAAETIYLAPLLTRPLETLHGLTVREITRAWRLLASLAVVLFRDCLPARTRLELRSTGEALSFCPTFERDEFVRCLVQDADFAPDQADVILDLFTFGRGAADELWLAPLVPVGDGLLAPALAPLAFPNLLRSHEHWLREGGLQMDLRGGHFERHIRDTVANAIQLPNAAAVRHSVTLTSGARPEEVDLLVRIGDTVLVGEVKCTLSPAVPVEFGRLFDLLDGAAAQVLRKVDAAGADIAELRRVTGWTDLPDRTRLAPVVVSNLAAAAGHAFRGVPVVDEFLLARFLNEGRVAHLVSLHEGPLGRAESVFYRTPDEAALVVTDYLAHPPQIEMLRQFTDWRTIQMLDMPGDVKPAEFQHCGIRVPDVITVPAAATPTARVSGAAAATPAPVPRSAMSD